MSTNIRYPNITGSTEKDQLQQLRSYLHQLVDQLNMTLKDVGVNSSVSALAALKGPSSGSMEEKKDPQSTFNDIKALIIKSADIVDAYYDEINTRMSGVYVAQSVYGVYTEKNDKVVSETAAGTEELYNNLQVIIGRVDGIDNQLIETDAYINRGILYYADDGAPVYGIEVGQRNESDGVEVFNKYARFTADRLSFYDQNDNEVAYVSDRKLHITNVEVTGSFLLGGFNDTALADGSVVTKWVGV